MDHTSERAFGGMKSPERGMGNKHGDMFPAPHWRDLWAAVLFYLHFAGFIGISLYAFVNIQHVDWNPSQPSPGPSGSLASLALNCLAAAAIISVALTVLSLSGMRRAPERMIHISFIGNIVWTSILSILSFAFKQWLLGIVLAILTVFTVVFYLVVRNRIPFSAILLRTVIDGLRAYPNMLSVTGGSVVISLVYIAYMTFTLWCLGVLHESRKDENTKWMAIYCVFSMFWSSQVLKNTVQTTIAGVYATFYFLHGTGQMIANPVAQSLRRSLSYSFGSICFGSLIVALIQLLRFVLNMAHDRDSIAGAIIDCILGIIQNLVEYFNYYAYTQIAIYGKPYVQAAKDTWNLVKSRGIDAVVNDSLVGTCTGMVSLGIGLISGAATFAISALIYAESTAVSITIAFLMGSLSMIIPYVALVIVEAGATTTFVCLAEDPASLQRTKPELYNAIMQKYSMMWA